MLKSFHLRFAKKLNSALDFALEINNSSVTHLGYCHFLTPLKVLSYDIASR